MTSKKLKSSMPTWMEMISSKSKKVTWSLPSRNSTRMPASQVPLAAKMARLAAIPIHEEDAINEVAEVAAAVTNLAKHPMSEMLRLRLISRKAVTMRPHPPRVARVATSDLKIARRAQPNDQTEIQLPNSQLKTKATSPSSNRLNAARKPLAVPPAAAMVMAAGMKTAASGDVVVGDNVVKLVATATTPAEEGNLEAKSPNTGRTVAPRLNAHPANPLQSMMTEMTLSILEMTPAKIRLATKTLRPGMKPSARSSMAT
jgi:hypothetical protein